MTPRVSVLMAVYNGEKYLGEAVESILSQTFTDFEFLVIDDGSVDSTPRLLPLYAQRDPRILIHRFKDNRGLSATLNFGIERACGEYIARMDADDICLPQRLEEQVKFLEAHPEIDVLGTGFTLFDESGNYLQRTAFPRNPDILRWNLLFFTPIAHPSVMLRSSILKKVGGYNTKFTSAQDYELWTRLILAGRLANLKEVHMLLRLHADRVTHTQREQQIAFTSQAKQKYLQTVLKRDIPFEAANNLRQKPRTARGAALAAALILDYCDTCSKDVPAPVAVRIMGSALKKTARKIGRFIVCPATWGIAVRFCSLVLRLISTWLRAAGKGTSA